jgi:hypothetical protein
MELEGSRSRRAGTSRGLVLDCLQRLLLNLAPYIPLTCHVSVLFLPISQPCTAVPPKFFPYTPLQP